MLRWWLYAPLPRERRVHEKERWRHENEGAEDARDRRAVVMCVRARTVKGHLDLYARAQGDVGTGHVSCLGQIKLVHIP